MPRAITYCPTTQVVRTALVSARLSSCEAQVFELLLDRQPNLLPSYQICSSLWPNLPISRAVRRLQNAVARIRAKIEPDPAHPIHLRSSYAGYTLSLDIPDQLQQDLRCRHPLCTRAAAFCVTSAALHAYVCAEHLAQALTQEVVYTVRPLPNGSEEITDAD